MNKNEQKGREASVTYKNFQMYQINCLNNSLEIISATYKL